MRQKQLILPNSEFTTDATELSTNLRSFYGKISDSIIKDKANATYNFLADDFLPKLSFRNLLIFERKNDGYNLKIAKGNTFESLESSIIKNLAIPIYVFDRLKNGCFLLKTSDYGDSDGQEKLIVDEKKFELSMEEYMSSILRSSSFLSVPFYNHGEIICLIIVGGIHKNHEQLRADYKLLQALSKVLSAIMDDMGPDKIEQFINEFSSLRMDQLGQILEKKIGDYDRKEIQLLQKEALLNRQWAELSRARNDFRELSGPSSNEQEKFEQQIYFSILRHSYGNMLARVKTERQGVGAIMNILDSDITNSDLEARLALHKISPIIDLENLDAFIDVFVKQAILELDIGTYKTDDLKESIFTFFSNNFATLNPNIQRAFSDDSANLTEVIKKIVIRKIHLEMLKRISDMEHDQNDLEEYLSRFLMKLINDQPDQDGRSRISSICNELIHKCKKYYKLEFKETISFEYMPICNDDMHLVMPIDQPSFIIDIFNNFLRNFLTQCINIDSSFQNGVLRETEYLDLVNSNPGLGIYLDRVFRKFKDNDNNGNIYVPATIFDTLNDQIVIREFEQIIDSELLMNSEHILERVKKLVSKFRYTLTPSKLEWIVDSSLQLFLKEYSPNDSRNILHRLFAMIFSKELENERFIGFTKKISNNEVDIISALLARLYLEKKQFWLILDYQFGSNFLNLRISDNLGGIPNDYIIQKSLIPIHSNQELITLLFEDTGKKFLKLREDKNQALQMVDVFSAKSESSTHALKAVINSAQPRKLAIFDGLVSTSSDSHLDRHGKGLLSVKKVLEKIGAKVNEHGIYGKGAEFNLEIPVVYFDEKSEEGIHQNEPQSKIESLNRDISTKLAQYTGARILVVEDSKRVSQRMKMLIEQTGDIHVDHAKNIHEAMSHLSQISYDLISLDLDLETSYGLDLLYYIQSGSGFHKHLSTPVVIVSTHINKSFAQSIQNEFSMVKDYLSKPWTDSDLMQLVIKNLENSVLDR